MRASTRSSKHGAGRAGGAPARARLSAAARLGGGGGGGGRHPAAWISARGPTRQAAPCVTTPPPPAPSAQVCGCACVAGPAAAVKTTGGRPPARYAARGRRALRADPQAGPAPGASVRESVGDPAQSTARRAVRRVCCAARFLFDESAVRCDTPIFVGPPPAARRPPHRPPVSRARAGAGLPERDAPVRPAGPLARRVAAAVPANPDAQPALTPPSIMAALVALRDENTAIRGPLKVRESGSGGKWKDR
jgi:hypothetical protein